MKIFLRPYKLSSKSSKDLAEALECKRIRPPTGRTYSPSDDHLVINWGSTREFPISRVGRFLNNPEAVGLSANKIASFELFDREGINTVEWTTSQAGAQDWLNSNRIVFGRDSATAAGGRGITVYHPNEGEQEVGRHLFYTKYIRKTHEWRIHVFRGEVIGIAEKRRKLDAEDAHPYIRSHAHGWVFCVNDCRQPPSPLVEQAVRSVEAAGLDFAGVDCIKGNNGKLAILELNTACGLEGRTLSAYATKIKELANA